MNPQVAAIAKAITGAIVAALTAMATAAQSNGIDASEWVTVAIAFFVALGAVYTIPNAGSKSSTTQARHSATPTTPTTPTPTTTLTPPTQTPTTPPDDKAS